MNVIEHGVWRLYVPPIEHQVKIDTGLPLSIMYAKRDGDNMDWYAYTKGEALAQHFVADNVKATVYWQEAYNAHVVGAASRDISLLFPASVDSTIIIEIEGYTGTNPQADFGNKIYNVDDKTFTDLPAREVGPSVAELFVQLKEANARIAKLEAKNKVATVTTGKQPQRR
jgi:hypothetical protein